MNMRRRTDQSLNQPSDRDGDGARATHIVKTPDFIEFIIILYLRLDKQRSSLIDIDNIE